MRNTVYSIKQTLLKGAAAMMAAAICITTLPGCAGSEKGGGESADSPAVTETADTSNAESASNESEAPDRSAADGSAESVEDYKVPFDESATYKKIEEILDENYESLEHDMAYDAKNRELNVYFQAPDNLRAALMTQDADLLKSWNNFIESMQKLDEAILQVAEVGGDADAVNVYLVDKLNSENDYTSSDYVLWIRNGEVKYNYADDSSASVSSPSQNSDGSGKETEAAVDTESSAGSDGHTPTFGEQNALETAYQYLDYTAFSYTGMIDQLEFEGYTHSEAVYAADNCGAVWDQQAVKMARQYLDYSSFSRSELKEQLEFEGFTSEQAEYAVSVVY